MVERRRADDAKASSNPALGKDNPRTIQVLLEAFRARSGSLIERLERLALAVRIDATPPIVTVFAAAHEAIAARQASRA